MLLSRSRSLPPNFAESVIDLEEKINLTCSIELVKDLLDLYSQAIEYYAAQHDPKHLHYQSRIQELLSRKEVGFVLKNPDLSINPHNPAVYDRRLQEKKRRISQNFTNRNLSYLRSADECIQKHTTSSHQLTIKLRENLSRQNNSLKNKIKKRRMHSYRSVISESDVSGG